MSVLLTVALGLLVLLVAVGLVLPLIALIVWLEGLARERQQR